MQALTAPSPDNIAHLALLVNCFDEDGFAKLAGVQLSTLSSWRRRGQGPEYVRLGSNFLYPIPAVQSYVTSLVKVRTKVQPKKVLM